MAPKGTHTSSSATLAAARRRLESLPNQGWVSSPAPVQRADALSEAFGVGPFYLKRDDLLPGLRGGTKVRKLDYLLAQPPFAAAPIWQSMGAIGSGHLVTLCAAARELGRGVVAHTFWEPLGPEIIANLASLASSAEHIEFSTSRTALALRRPWLLMGLAPAHRPIVPPGATSAAGMVGMVKAGLELALQIEAGECPEPRVVYVPLGSGGSVVGLSVGLALAGIRCRLVGVATVERAFCGPERLRMLSGQLLRWLRLHAVPGAEALRPLAIFVDRSQLGRGYADRAAPAVAVCGDATAAEVPLEPVYSGKAMAALVVDERARLATNYENGAALFWVTPHRDPEETDAPDDDWRARLPPALLRRLSHEGTGPRLTRRTLVFGGGSALVLGAALLRTSGYEALPGAPGAFLAAWEMHVIIAAAELVLPLLRGDSAALNRVARAVDGYGARLPSALAREIHAMLLLVEHGTPLGGRLSRFTELSVAQRGACLEALAGHGALLALAYRGLRDLCVMGYYQLPESWAALGYEGPRVPADSHPSGPGRAAWPTYDSLKALDGARPKGMAR